MFAVYLLRDERAEFDGVRDEQEKPVEQHDTVGIPRSPVFDVLDVEDEKKGDDGEDRGPETEVTGPYVLVVFDLEGSLNCGSSDERSDCRLDTSH